MKEINLEPDPISRFFQIPFILLLVGSHHFRTFVSSPYYNDWTDVLVHRISGMIRDGFLQTSIPFIPDLFYHVIILIYILLCQSPFFGVMINRCQDRSAMDNAFFHVLPPRIPNFENPIEPRLQAGDQYLPGRIAVIQCIRYSCRSWVRTIQSDKVKLYTLHCKYVIFNQVNTLEDKIRYAIFRCECEKDGGIHVIARIILNIPGFILPLFAQGSIGKKQLPRSYWIPKVIVIGFPVYDPCITDINPFSKGNSILRFACFLVFPIITISIGGNFQRL
jgi:hypothetical protein